MAYDSSKTFVSGATLHASEMNELVEGINSKQDTLTSDLITAFTKDDNTTYTLTQDETNKNKLYFTSSANPSTPTEIEIPAGGSGEENVINSISFNGSDLTPSEKKVSITETDPVFTASDASKLKFEDDKLYYVVSEDTISQETINKLVPSTETSAVMSEFEIDPTIIIDWYDSSDSVIKNATKVSVPVIAPAEHTTQVAVMKCVDYAQSNQLCLVFFSGTTLSYIGISGTANEEISWNDETQTNPSDMCKFTLSTTTEDVTTLGVKYQIYPAVIS